MHCIKPVLVAITLVGVLPACSKQKIEPSYASSATSPGYASRFPEELASIRQGYFDQEHDVKETTKAFLSYPDDLQEPEWAAVLEVYQHADQEGGSQSYADRLEQTDAVKRFYEQEKNEIRQKVAGAVQYTAKKKNCEGDIGSSAGGALDKAFEERLEESLHDASDAHAIIEQNETALGPKNVATLEEQVDAISKASYMARIGVVRSKLRLRQMVEESDEIEKTLDRTVTELSEREKQAKDDKQRALFSERKSAAVEAKGRIASERDGAKKLADEVEKRIEELQKAYQAAFDGLVKKVEERKASAPKKAARLACGTGLLL